MTETEIQKLFAYQYGLLNNNLVLPNITMKGSEGGNYEADLIYINKFLKLFPALYLFFIIIVTQAYHSPQIDSIRLFSRF